MKVRCGYASLVLILFPLLCTAEQAITDSSLEMLMKLSGSSSQIEQIPANVVAGMEQANIQGPGIPKNIFVQLKAAALTSFRSSDYIAAFEEAIRANTSEQDAIALLQWYQSDLGREIAKREEHAGTPQAYQEMLSLSVDLLDDEHTLAYAKKLDDLLGASDFATQLQIHTIVAILSSLAIVADPEGQLSIERVLNQVANYEKQIRSETEQVMLLSIVYTYRGLTPAELNRYLEFLRTPAAKSFHQQIIRAIGGELRKSIDRFAEELTAVAQGTRKAV